MEDRKARTFRIPSQTNNTIKAIGKRLNENDTEVLIRAVDYLNSNLKLVVEEENNKRIVGLK